MWTAANIHMTENKRTNRAALTCATGANTTEPKIPMVTWTSTISLRASHGLRATARMGDIWHAICKLKLRFAPSREYSFTVQQQLNIIRRGRGRATGRRYVDELCICEWRSFLQGFECCPMQLLAQIIHTFFFIGAAGYTLESTCWKLHCLSTKKEVQFV